MTGPLLVCSRTVRERLKAAGVVMPPAWADPAEVTDVELKEAAYLSFVWGEEDDAESRNRLIKRAFDQGRTNSSLGVQSIEKIELKIAQHVEGEAKKQREDDERALRWARAQRTAAETLATEDAASDGSPAVASFTAELDVELDDDDWLVQGLVPVDGRVVLGGFRKAGKTVLALNLATAHVTGEPFLGRFEMRKPDVDRSVVWLNLELTRRTARRWVHGLGTWNDHEALNRVIGVHARGAVSTYAVTSRAGEYALEKLLTEHAAETLIVDPVAPLMSVCGLDVNSSQDVGRFLALMDRILHRVGVPQIFYTAHVGKSSNADEGNESVMGATRWEDAVDSIILIGKERQSGTRWIRAEGRDISLDNATLVFDEGAKRLTIDEATSRYEAELLELAKQVLLVVRTSPGIRTGPLTGDLRIVGTKGKRLAAIQKAIDLGWIEVRAGQGTSKLHWALV